MRSVPVPLFHAHSLLSFSLSFTLSLPPSHPSNDVSFTRFPSRALSYRPLSLSLSLTLTASATLLRHSRARSRAVSLRSSLYLRLFSRLRAPRAPVRAPCPRAYRNCTTATVNSLVRSGRSLRLCPLIYLSLSVSLPSVSSVHRRYITGQRHRRYTHTPRFTGEKSGGNARDIR